MKKLTDKEVNKGMFFLGIIALLIVAFRMIFLHDFSAFNTTCGILLLIEFFFLILIHKDINKKDENKK